MKWLRRSHGEVTGHPLPAQPTIVAIHLHRPGDLAAAEHCLSGRVSKVYVMSGRRMKRTQAHAEALRHLCEGSVVLMAPEGIRSWASQVHRLDVEVARLALDAEALVVPAQVVAGQLNLGTSVDMSRHAATPHSHAVLRLRLTMSRSLYASSQACRTRTIQQCGQINGLTRSSGCFRCESCVVTVGASSRCRGAIARGERSRCRGTGPGGGERPSCRSASSSTSFLGRSAC
ncbi:acyltransferase [Cutibacterium acnes JCM 18920]|nr:acyltransferase [Cutibacterium acnes JCM 18920]